MFIDGMLPKARERLVSIADDAPLIQAAKRLQAGTDLVKVCDSAGLLVGVITKADIVARISHCQGASCITPAASVMTRDVVALRIERPVARCLGTHEGTGSEECACRGSGLPASGAAPRTRHSASSSKRVGKRGFHVAGLCDGCRISLIACSVEVIRRGETRASSNANPSQSRCLRDRCLSRLT
jgi:CBS domain-containing protein